jgi:hypothetical protein
MAGQYRWGLRMDPDQLFCSSRCFRATTDLLRYNNQVECVGVNVATAATIGEYSLLRDQLWFGLQKWLKDGGRSQQTRNSRPSWWHQRTRLIFAGALRWNQRRRSRSGCANRLTARMPLRLPSARCYQEGRCASRGSEGLQLEAVDALPARVNPRVRAARHPDG